GPAVVQQVPDDFHRVPARRAHVRLDRAEVELARRALDAMPPHGVADGRQALGPEARVVLVDEPVVLRGLEHVEAYAMAVDVARGLEAAHPERLEERGPEAVRILHASAVLEVADAVRGRGRLRRSLPPVSSKREAGSRLTTDADTADCGFRIADRGLIGGLSG